jgi:formate hydrogenlyase subunit 3/multisubunit Na+/H+ antiporter MnhD subunit
MTRILRPWLAPLLGLGGSLSLAVAAQSYPLRSNLARRTVVLALCVFVGSLLDALLTLGHLAHGGAEANPWLARALTYSTAQFLLLKMGLTGAGVWILAAHHQCPLAVRGLNGVALVYGAVLVYHLLLYVRLV